MTTSILQPPISNNHSQGKITLRLDTSQLVQVMKCPTFHNFVSVENIVPKRADRTSMDRGTIMHGLLERYYTKIWERDSPSTAMNYAMSQLNSLKKDIKLEQDDYARITKRFFDYYIKYINDNITVSTLSNGKPAVEIGFSVPLVDNENFYFVLEGRIDMITSYSGQEVIWDHKCQARSYLLYEQSMQVLNYCTAVGAKMFQYNYVRLHEKIQPNTFYRATKYIQPMLLDKWKKKLVTMFYKIAASKMEGNFIEKDFPNQSCSDIGFGKVCPYTKLCEESNPRIRQALIEMNYQAKKAWEPWTLEEIVEEA